MHYLDTSDEHCSAYMSFLLAINFVERVVLEGVEGRLRENRVRDRVLALKLLYHQMYYSDEQMEDLMELDEECSRVVREIVNEDD